MAKQLEAFNKDYAALLRELDSAALQLKEAEQQRAQHDEALREAARALGQRLAVLRGSAAPAGGLEPFKTDPGVRRLLAALDEQLAQAEAGRQHAQGLLSGPWGALLKRSAALEKELGAEILARQKLSTTKTGLANKSLGEMVLLQQEVKKKLAPRRTALQTGGQALPFVKDPEYFRKRRDEWQAAAVSGQLAASAPAPQPPKAAPGPAAGKASAAGNGTAASAAPARKRAAPPAATPPPPSAGTPPPVSGSAPEALDSLLNAEAFKATVSEVREVFAHLRASSAAARAAATGNKADALAKAKNSAARQMETLEELIKPYELARRASDDEAIARRPNGRQLIGGLRTLLAVRNRGRAIIRVLAGLKITRA